MEEEVFKNPLAKKIWDKIMVLSSTQADDSDLPKFLNYDFILPAHLYATTLSYVATKPNPKVRGLQNTTIYSLYPVLIAFGINIYLTRHSVETHGSPYSIKTDEKEIELAQQNASKACDSLKIVPIFLEELINHWVQDFRQQIDSKQNYKNYKIKKRIAKKYLEQAVIYGYCLAPEIIIP